MAKEQVFQWLDGEPPPAPPRRGYVDDVLVQLATKPGHWARIRGPYKNRGNANSMASGWNKKHTQFEFVARPGLDGAVECYIYARKRGRGGRRRSG